MYDTVKLHTSSAPGRCAGLYAVICVQCLLAVLSCAGRMTADRSEELRGYWQTDRNIIMSIHMTPGYGLAAVIKESPGFLSEDTKPGTVVISQIRPRTGGGFTGLFMMPGNLEPVNVRLAVSGNTLRIDTWDRKAQGKIMKWIRVRRTP